MKRPEPNPVLSIIDEGGRIGMATGGPCNVAGGEPPSRTYPPRPLWRLVCARMRIHSVMNPSATAYSKKY